MQLLAAAGRLSRCGTVTHRSGGRCPVVVTCSHKLEEPGNLEIATNEVALALIRAGSRVFTIATT